MKQHVCHALHPETKTQCERVERHPGDHKRNGLVWSPVPDPINPAYYTNHPTGIECIQVVEHMNFNRGNAIKYVWRAGEKGPAAEDLRKAIWYLNREIARLNK